VAALARTQLIGFTKRTKKRVWRKVAPADGTLYCQSLNVAPARQAWIAAAKKQTTAVWSPCTMRYRP